MSHAVAHRRDKKSMIDCCNFICSPESHCQCRMRCSRARATARQWSRIGEAIAPKVSLPAKGGLPSRGFDRGRRTHNHGRGGGGWGYTPSQTLPAWRIREREGEREAFRAGSLVVASEKKVDDQDQTPGTTMVTTFLIVGMNRRPRQQTFRARPASQPGLGTVLSPLLSLLSARAGSFR